MADANIFLRSLVANATARNRSWTGGVNVTAIRMAEERAFGWYHALKEGAASNPHEPGPPVQQLGMNRQYAGTGRCPLVRGHR